MADLLQRLGHEPARRQGIYLWYRSPLRPGEAVPSFKVNTQWNSWYDFGEGAGGNILDFVKRLEGLSNVPDTLDAIERIVGRPSLFNLPALPPAAATSAPEPAGPVHAEELSIKAITHPGLLDYLKSRGIAPATARDYGVMEAHYTRNSRRLFSLAFPNDAGGYELRSARFKGTTGPKGMTLIEHPERNSGELMIFEGFTDMLSAAELGLLTKQGPGVLVLNSAAMRDRAVELIQRRPSQDLHLYLDHDAAGRQLVGYFKAQLPDARIEDRSSLYAGHKDLNEYLQSAHRQRSL